MPSKRPPKQDLTGLTLLGDSGAVALSKTLETFPNPNPGRPYTIRMRIPESTCPCPKTGQPDFATLHLEYVPKKACVELTVVAEYGKP